jgi:phospho-N-acetylmuramoyl-pentapeptide-transferase
MMYFLFHWRGTYSVLNVFQYITFRSIGAAVTSFLLSLMFGNWVIRRLISLKVGQPIRTKAQVRELAELHGGKAGTPTMGGVLLLGTVVVSTLIWGRLTNRVIWLALFTIVYLGLLGFVDDYLKVTKKKIRRNPRPGKDDRATGAGGGGYGVLPSRSLHTGPGAGVVCAIL